MIPNRHAMVGARYSTDPALIVALTANAGVPIAWPSVTRPQYVAALFKHGVAPPAPWTALAPVLGNRPGIYTLSLGPSDISSPLTPDQNYNCLLYRGVQSIALRGTLLHQGVPGAEANVMGFTKSPNCAGRLAVAAGSLAYGLSTLSALPTIAGNNNGLARWTVEGNLDTSFASGVGVDVTWDPADPGNGGGWAMLELLK